MPVFQTVKSQMNLHINSLDRAFAFSSHTQWPGGTQGIDVDKGSGKNEGL